MQEILWLTKNRMNCALSTVAFFEMPVSRNDALLVRAVLSVFEIPVSVVGKCVDFVGAMFFGRDPGIRNTGCPSSPVVKQSVALLSVLKRKGQLALALLIWCPEEDLVAPYLLACSRIGANLAQLLKNTVYHAARFS